MIEFSVTNLVKAFTIGDNILDGLTFHINQGERVGLLGKNSSSRAPCSKSSPASWTTMRGKSPSPPATGWG